MHRGVWVPRAGDHDAADVARLRQIETAVAVSRGVIALGALAYLPLAPRPSRDLLMLAAVLLGASALATWLVLRLPVDGTRLRRVGLFVVVTDIWLVAMGMLAETTGSEQGLYLAGILVVLEGAVRWRRAGGDAGGDAWARELPGLLVDPHAVWRLAVPLRAGGRQVGVLLVQGAGTAGPGVRDRRVLESRRAEERAAVTVDVPDGLGVLADPRLLRRVIGNLLDNACRYAPGPPLVEARGLGDEVVLAVADRGPGIPAGERARLFERFRRGAGARRRHRARALHRAGAPGEHGRSDRRGGPSRRRCPLRRSARPGRHRCVRRRPAGGRPGGGRRPVGTMSGVHPPSGRRDWVALVADPLPVEAALRWVAVPGAGAVVSFLGTVRDHSEGRVGVRAITYEAYEEAAGRALVRLVAGARGRWPDLCRVVVWHRVGDVPLGEASVAVVVSCAHRGPAFEAGRFLIDALKETVPIWKREHWAGGSDWATDARPIRRAAALPGGLPVPSRRD